MVLLRVSLAVSDSTPENLSLHRPVQGDDSDGSDGDHDVGALDERHELAEGQAQGPLAPQDADQSERHADQAESHVGDGEVDDVEVSGRVHLRAPRHHEAHEQVGSQPRDHEEAIDANQNHLETKEGKLLSSQG